MPADTFFRLRRYSVVCGEPARALFRGIVRPLSDAHVQDDQSTPKRFEPAQEQAEVVAGRGDDGVDGVACLALEAVVADAVFGLRITW